MSLRVNAFRSLGFAGALALVTALVPAASASAAGTATISGHLYYRTAEAGVYPEGIWVYLRNPSNGQTTNHVTTGADGGFVMNAVEAGSFEVCAYSPVPPHNAFPNCWGDEELGPAPELVVTAGQVITDIDIPIDPAGSLAGTLVAQATPSGPITPLTTGRVIGYRFDGSTYVYEGYAGVQSDGSFALGPLTPGEYAFQFSDDSGVYNTEYWEDVPYFFASTDITIETGVEYQIGEILLETTSLDVERVTGADRFGTSVAVSQGIYPSVPPGGVPVVYVANGLNYPDALAAGPAAIAKGGVVLLTYPWDLPAVVRDELERLSPQRIVAVGGPPSVSDAVVTQLEALEFAPLVERITGDDRFGTSREIARDTFDDATVAFIATGLNYPDALAAGPPAGSLGAPIILVNGLMSSVDDDTLDLLADLGVQDVYIIGGTPSVSAGIEADLRDVFGSAQVVRLTGADRFGTSVAISQWFYSEADIVFLATGMNFPDALAGGPAAAAFGGPLLLSRAQCIPAAVLLEIDQLDANGLVLLGGYPSLSANVEALGVC
jgi:putative cell wall-binding protein